MKTGGRFGGGICIEEGCDKPTANTRCKACYLKLSAPETPLRKLSRESGKSIAQLAREHDIPERTARQYAAGYGIGGKWGARAIAVHKATGIPYEILLADTEDAAERRQLRAEAAQMSLFEES